MAALTLTSSAFDTCLKDPPSMLSVSGSGSISNAQVAFDCNIVPFMETCRKEGERVEKEKEKEKTRKKKEKTEGESESVSE